MPRVACASSSRSRVLERRKGRADHGVPLGRPFGSAGLGRRGSAATTSGGRIDAATRRVRSSTPRSTPASRSSTPPTSTATAIRRSSSAARSARAARRRDRRDEVRRCRWATGRTRRGGSRRYVMRAVEASLRRLGTDYIDLYQMHAPDPTTPIEETLDALTDLVHQGKVRYLGSSNFSGWQIADADWTSRSARPRALRRARRTSGASCAGRWSDEVVPACERFGASLLPYFPLAGGALTGKYRRGEPAPAGTRLVGDNGPAGSPTPTSTRIEALESVRRPSAVTPLVSSRCVARVAARRVLGDRGRDPSRTGSRERRRARVGACRATTGGRSTRSSPRRVMPTQRRARSRGVGTDRRRGGRTSPSAMVARARREPGHDARHPGEGELVRRCRGAAVEPLPALVAGGLPLPPGRRPGSGRRRSPPRSRSPCPVMLGWTLPVVRERSGLGEHV